MIRLIYIIYYQMDCRSNLEILPKDFYHKDIFYYWISNGMDINQSLIFGTELTVLEASIILGKHDIVKILLEGGANPKCNNNFAMELAFESKEQNYIDLLRIYGPDDSFNNNDFSMKMNIMSKNTNLKCFLVIS
jgi:hypothetical protein